MNWTHKSVGIVSAILAMILLSVPLFFSSAETGGNSDVIAKPTVSPEPSVTLSGEPSSSPTSTASSLCDPDASEVPVEVIPADVSDEGIVSTVAVGPLPYECANFVIHVEFYDVDNTAISGGSSIIMEEYTIVNISQGIHLDDEFSVSLYVSEQ